MFERVRPILLIGSLVAFSPSNSMAAANKEHLQLMADIRMLHEQTQQLQAMLGTLADAMKVVTARLDEQAGVNRKAFADQKLLIDNISSDLRVVREKADETNVRVTSLAQELEALRMAIPSGASPQMPEAGASPSDAAGGPAAMPGAAAISLGTSPQKLYEQAWADYASGQWAIAIQGFRNYLKAFPKSELADDAQWFIGESYYLDGKNNEALDAYDQVIKNYPGGDKVPDAYYKRGVVFDRLGQTDRARQSYEFVAKNYPETPAGRLAKQRLNRQDN